MKTRVFFTVFLMSALYAFNVHSQNRYIYSSPRDDANGFESGNELKGVDTLAKCRADSALYSYVQLAPDSKLLDLIHKADLLEKEIAMEEEYFNEEQPRVAHEYDSLMHIEDSLSFLRKEKADSIEILNAKKLGGKKRNAAVSELQIEVIMLDEELDKISLFRKKTKILERAKQLSRRKKVLENQRSLYQECCDKIQEKKEKIRTWNGFARDHYYERTGKDLYLRAKEDTVLRKIIIAPEFNSGP